MKYPFTLLIAAMLAVFSFTAPASAQADRDQQVSDFDLSASVSALSDYRFRGVSLSNRDPMFQASIDLRHSSGFYGEIFGSTVANTGGSKVEIDAALGFKKDVGPITLDVGATAYFYPGGSGVNYYEGYGYVGKSIGPAELRIGAVYAPKQDNLGGDDNLYISGDARVGIPNLPFTLTASVGHEEGAFAGPNSKKWDWSAGVEYTHAPFTLAVTYNDTDIKRFDDPSGDSDAGIMFSLSFEF